MSPENLGPKLRVKVRAAAKAKAEASGKKVEATKANEELAILPDVAIQHNCETL